MDELINEIKNLKLQLNILNDKLDKLSKNNLSNKNKKWSFKEQLLINELKNSININIISKSHERTKFAIECRI